MSSPPPSPHLLDRMDAAVRAAGVGVWLNPLPLGELVWNENTKAHFHLPPDARPTIELFFERLHADDRERVRLAVARAVAEDAAFDEVYRTVGPGGELKWIHAAGRLVRGEDGQPRQFDGITLDITAPVSAQQQLRHFADSAPAMLWVTESDGRCTFLSRAWTDFTGQPEIEGLGFGWLERVHPEDRPKAEAAFLDATARQTPFALEHRVRRANGRWAWVIDAGRPRIDAHGEFLGFAGSVTDIDDRRRAEDALRRSSDRYAQLLESIDEGFCIVQVLLDGERRPVDYRFVETNHVFERQTGLDRPVGRTARELVPGLEDFWFETYGDVALHRAPRRFTHGSQAMGRWFDVFASPIGEPAERLVAILFRDVTDRMQQERRLRESEERYRGFLASSTEGIWRMEFDPPVDTALPPEQQVDAIFEHGRFAECNHVLARMYGLALPDELVGQGLSLTMDRDEPHARAYLLGLIASGYRAAEVESLEHDRDGRPVWFANNLSGVIENGLLVRAWGTQRDITDRKRAEAALVEADRRKDEFLATLAHELRNPLAPIRSAAELLRRRGGDDVVLNRHAEMIGRQVSHLARMIDDLMDVSRVTRGRLELRLAPVVLQDVVRAALDNAREALQAGRHEVSLALPDAPLRLLGDEVRLVQVVLNLLTNAARYSADGAPVTVAVEAEGGQARLRVCDQGVGIAPEQMSRLFELFWQGGATGDRAGGGLGIGLSLVRRLVELHGGTVQAHSAGLGQGSEFVVCLPLVVAAHDAPPLIATDPAEAHSSTVLIVDDNRDAADTLAEVLRLSGYEVATAYDGVEGLAVAQAVRPDVVVLDLGMPRLDGYATCRALRERQEGRTMTVLALSGWGQAADKARAAEAGFDAHLVKPVDPDALVQAIEAARRARR
jgi:PAS domain S-box-containing protein